MTCFTLDNVTNTSINIVYARNVENLQDIRNQILSGNLNCCIIKPHLIVDPFQVIVAANKAAVYKHTGILKTKSLNTELLFNLFPSKNISTSLKTFGIDETDQHALFVVFEEKGAGKIDLESEIKGEILNLDDIKKFTDEAAVKKTYKITEEELQVSSLLDSVVSRIASKDLE